jgi:RNA recognition motif. (a.k.a. RRM, RBD, or RNP domain)
MFDPFQTQIDLFTTSFSTSQDSWPVFTQQNLPPPKSLENIFSYDRPTTPPDSFSSFNFEQDNDRPESMRTLYFGNLPPDLDVGEFLNYIRGGILDEVKYLYSKNCIFVTFVDAAVAASCYLEYQKTPLSFEGYDCRVGWGKPSSMHPTVRQQILKGACRNVFLGNIDADVTAEDLFNEFQKYGAVDCIKVLPEKRIAFVHMCSIAAAIKAVSILGEDPMWIHRRIYYGRDRCCTQTTPTPAPVSFVPEENRTVYIGGIHPEATCKELCDVRIYILL